MDGHTARITLGQFPVEMGLDEAIRQLQQLPQAQMDRSLVLIGGTSPVHAEGKQTIIDYCNATGSIVLRASERRQDRVALLCRPGIGVSSLHPGEPLSLEWATIVVGLDDDVYYREPARDAAAAGAGFFLTWPRWEIDVQEIGVIQAIGRRARKNAMYVAALFPSGAGGVGISGATSALASPSGQVVTRLPAATTAVAAVPVNPSHVRSLVQVARREMAPAGS